VSSTLQTSFSFLPWETNSSGLPSLTPFSKSALPVYDVRYWSVEQFFHFLILFLSSLKSVEGEKSKKKLSLKKVGNLKTKNVAVLIVQSNLNLRNFVFICCKGKNSLKGNL